MDNVFGTASRGPDRQRPRVPKLQERASRVDISSTTPPIRIMVSPPRPTPEVQPQLQRVVVRWVSQLPQATPPSTSCLRSQRRVLNLTPRDYTTCRWFSSHLQARIRISSTRVITTQLMGHPLHMLRSSLLPLGASLVLPSHYKTHLQLYSSQPCRFSSDLYLTGL